MGNVETFVTIHDQGLVFASEETEQFASLSSYRYLFVGPKPVDKLPKDILEKVIVCRDFSPNYEHYPHLYDFTGWYVLTKHNLMSKPYAICLQYDHFLADSRLEETVESMLSGADGVISFLMAYDHMYMLSVPGFEQAMREALAIKGVSFDALNLAVWPTTQGTAWRKESLTDFLGWVEPIFDQISSNRYMGHIAERMVAAYACLTHPARYLHGMAHHVAMDCHGTGAAMAGSESSFIQKSLTFGK